MSNPHHHFRSESCIHPFLITEFSSRFDTFSSTVRDLQYFQESQIFICIIHYLAKLGQSCKPVLIKKKRQTPVLLVLALSFWETRDSNFCNILDYFLWREKLSEAKDQSQLVCFSPLCPSQQCPVKRYRSVNSIAAQ